MATPARFYRAAEVAVLKALLDGEPRTAQEIAEWRAKHEETTANTAALRGFTLRILRRWEERDGMIHEIDGRFVLDLDHPRVQRFLREIDSYGGIASSD